MEQPGRSAESVAAEVRRRLAGGQLDLPLPGSGRTAARWAALAAFGAQDLCVARLVEGHTDALAILAEAGRPPVAGALYGVWASRSGGGLELARSGQAWALRGTMRFCSGAGHLDRALVAAGDRLLDVDLADPGVRPDPSSWPTLGMDASASLDVAFDLEVPEGSVVGPPGFYTRRCGFALGGGGVAAVWLGGAIGLCARAMAASSPDPHRLAIAGSLHTANASADALLRVTAAAVDAAPGADHAVQLATCRSAAEAAGRQAVDLVPRLTGPGPLTHDVVLARQLADLGVYLRQHHGERDLAALGESVWPAPAAR